MGLFLLVLSLLFLSSEGGSCVPTLGSELGPVYLPGAPFKTTICEHEPPSYFYQSTKSHPMLLRETIKTDGPAWLHMSGVVRGADNNCSVLDGAEIDVWQADASGSYGPMVGNPGFCRGVLKTGKDGSYALKTHIPSTYGLLRVFFGDSWVPDAPPFGPRHIHVVVYHPRYKLGMFQVYFHGDPASEFDFRSKLAGESLGADDPMLMLPSSGKFDFVLAPLAPGDKAYTSRQEALLAQCPTLHAPCPGLCAPHIACFLRPSVFFGVVFVWLIVVYFVLRKLCCGRRANQRTAQSKKAKKE